MSRMKKRCRAFFSPTDALNQVKMLVLSASFCLNVSVRRFRLFLSAVSASCLVLLWHLPAFSATQARITIDQVSSKGLGSWTLITANGASYSSMDGRVNLASHSLALSDFGPVTLSVASPQGMSVRILMYRGGDLLKTIEMPQHSFTLYPNDQYRFLVQYTLNRTGSLGITSNPSGVRMRVKGESGRTYTAVTPHTFNGIPAGRYSVSLGTLQGCIQPRTDSIIVLPEQRNTLNFSLNCEKNQQAAVSAATRPTKRALVEYAQSREFKSRGNRK